MRTVTDGLLLMCDCGRSRGERNGGHGNARQRRPQCPRKSAHTMKAIVVPKRERESGYTMRAITMPRRELEYVEGNRKSIESQHKVTREPIDSQYKENGQSIARQ
jgi:hypothetical protein